MKIVQHLEQLSLPFRAPGAARSSLRNALYGSAEYIALPLTMLLATPYLLHRMGLAQYGLWMVATAAITSSSYISTGFGDAALKYAAAYRGKNDLERVAEILRVNLTINLVLGTGLAIAIWLASPLAVRHIPTLTPALQSTAIPVFRISAFVLVVRSIESVFVAALRAYERYGPAVQINVAVRIAMIAAACLLVANGRGLLAIMVAMLLFACASALLQMMAARTVLGRIAFYPSIKPSAFSEVFHFGCFSWLQALAGCMFSYADRLLIGFMLGATSVAYYSVCVQAAQPIHGLIAAGLHFTFPHLSARMSSASEGEMRRVVLKILSLNLLLTAVLCLPLVLLSKLILRVWMGAAFAQQTWVILSIVAVGFGLLALNITGHYALLALEQVRLVSLLNILGGLAMIAAVVILAPRFGLKGAAIGRLLYGPITLLMYFRLRSILAADSPTRIPVSASAATAEQGL
jgi:O-antigen/teichoic acid export membrane protein